MYKMIAPYFQHEDPRGSITGILDFGKWEEMNFITSVKGTIRGGHYHEQTEELFFVLSGTIRVTFEEVIDQEKIGLKETRSFSTGDAFVVFPRINHTFEVLEDATWINVLSRRMDREKPDFHRIPQKRMLENSLL